LRNGTCESALLVTKKFAFHQIERDSSAVQLYERASAARADVVNRARDQFFPGPCFALDKNGGAGRSDALNFSENGFQGGTVAYDLLESALISVIGFESLESRHRTPFWRGWMRSLVNLIR
jgi:hypothetical protein